MAFAITVSSNIDDTLQRLATRQDQLIGATVIALNETVGQVRQAEVHEIGDVFDRPTPFTLNSPQKRLASRDDLTAHLWLKSDVSGGTPADKYLNSEIHGGFRRDKAFELALQRAGVMPPGHVAVPGSAAKLDAYGNISRGTIVQLLSYFRTFGLAGYNANITDARKARLARGTKRRVGFVYFVGRPGDGRLPLGIWQRFNFARGSAIKPILLFVDGAKYQPIFDFTFVAAETVRKVFASEFAQALQQVAR